MTTETARHWYTIKEAAALTGLPASTLRYYESIGVIAPIRRGATSRHRVYDETDLDQLMWIACLAATGMSVSDMRRYVAHGRIGRDAAADQVHLLQQQQARLTAEAEHLEIRRRYVALKIDYWRAVEDGDQDRADQLGREAGTLADQLRRTKP